MPSLAQGAIEILRCADAAEKARLSADQAAAWRRGDLDPPSETTEAASAPPNRPGRPGRPELVPPRLVKRRRITSGSAGRIALLHALAHIELNAIDLAWDMVARFGQESLPRAFYDDWVRVGDEEARHFLLLRDRLSDLGAAYGDLPAHDGLWEAAAATAHDLLARLAVVPLVLEARGLDVTPAMIDKLLDVGDAASAEALKIIYADEIGHVAIGKRWFDFLCDRRDLNPQEAWQDLVARYFKGSLKPPFNGPARAEAGLPESFYAPLAG